MIGVVVGHEQVSDLPRFKPFGSHVVDHHLAAVEAGVDHPETVSGIDDVAVGVQPAGEVEAVVAAADEVQVVVDLHESISSSEIE